MYSQRLGEMPDKIPLSQIADVLGGFAFKSEDFNAAGIPVVRIANIEPPHVNLSDCAKIPENKVIGLDRFKLEDGDIVMAMTGATIGKAGRVRSTTPAYLNQRVAKISAKAGHEFDDFVWAIVSRRGFEEEVLNNAGGSAQANVSAEGIGRIRIPNLSTDEQLAIGKVIRTLDDKIELNRRMNRTVEELAARLFRSWFVDFDPVIAKAAGRKPAHLRPELFSLFPTDFQDSELGPIPQGWRVAALSEIASINAHKMSRNYTYTEIEYLDISSVIEGVINGTTRIARTAAPSRAQRLVVHGDTIWSCVRPNRRSFAFIQDPPENMVVSTGFATLTPTCGSPAFIYTATTTDDFTDYLTAHAEGSAYPAVRPETFENAPVVVPTAELLNEFEKIVSPWLAQVAHNIRESRTLAALRDTLLPKLLSGELREQAENLVTASS